MKSISKSKRIITAVVAILMIVSMIAGSLITAFADETKIVTLGVDLSDEQKQLMLNYFGVDETQVEIVYVNNQDEHSYLGNYIPAEKIGKHTYSCTYIEPTNEGGIHIKTVNLNYVDCDMIRNALITSGITNANVICASPIEVSGTGAMVGVFKAYESIKGEELDEEKVELASEELVTTIEISQDIGKEETNDLIAELKEQAVEAGSDATEEDILDMINKYIEEHSIILTEEQKWKLVELLLKISKKDYDIDEIKKSYQDLKETIEKVQKTTEETKNFVEKVVDFFKTLWQKLTGTYEEVKENEELQEFGEKLGIINQTNDDLLSDDTVVTNTEDNSILEQIKDSNGIVTQEDKQSFWDSIVRFFKNFFGSGDKKEEPEVVEDITEDKNEVTFEDFSNIKEEVYEEPVQDEIVDVEENDEQQKLDYVTYELQDLDPDNPPEPVEEVKTSEENNNTESTGGVKSFDELTQ